MLFQKGNIRAGFTLIELLVVIAVGAVVFAVVGSQMGRLVSKQALLTSAHDVALVANRAHISAREAKDNQAWGIASVSSNQYALVSGSAAAPTISATYGLKSAISFVNTPFAIWFGQGTGYATATVITLTNPTNDTRQVSVSTFGTVEVP